MHTQIHDEAVWTWRLVRSGEFKLDAGSMMGILPRAVWSRTVSVDDAGRMTLQQNTVLLERDTNIPPLPELLDEVSRLQTRYDIALARWSGASAASEATAGAEQVAHGR